MQLKAGRMREGKPPRDSVAPAMKNSSSVPTSRSISGSEGRSWRVAPAPSTKRFPLRHSRGGDPEHGSVVDVELGHCAVAARGL